MKGNFFNDDETTKERLVRVEVKVDNLTEETGEIKESVKGLKKIIVIAVASSSFLSNGNFSSLAELVGNHFDETHTNNTKLAKSK